MTRATPDQLQNLPGFGQVKVKNIKNAFQKSFRNQATSSIAISHSQEQARSATAQSNSTSSRPARPASPEWDIEYDDIPLPDQDQDVEVIEERPAKSRAFDVDLDLT